MAVYPLVGLAPEWRPLVFLGMLGFAGLLLALAVAWPAAVGWSMSALVLQYGLSLVGRSAIDVYALLYGALMVVTTELALSVIERRPVASTRRPMPRFEIVRIAALGAGTATLAGLVLLVTSIDLPHERWLPPVAIGAVTISLAIFVSLARRRST